MRWPFDFVARQRCTARPSICSSSSNCRSSRPAATIGAFGAATARELVRDHVLRLTYIAHDLAPFACDLVCGGAPFPWDPEQRRHLRARLDALYFHLYGLSRKDAAYVICLESAAPVCDFVGPSLRRLLAGRRLAVVALRRRAPAERRVRPLLVVGCFTRRSCRSVRAVCSTISVDGLHIAHSSGMMSLAGMEQDKA